MKPRIVVVGSSNTDMVVRVPRFPTPGETVLGSGFVKVGGGKGANQAIAAARLGAEVTLVARLGVDDFGKEAILGYRREGLNLDYLVFDDVEPSGVALIMVDGTGQNIISVAQGANARLTSADVERAVDAIARADFVLVQHEIPSEVVRRAIEISNRLGVPVLLNPAPAVPVPQGFFSGVDMLTPNIAEAEVYSGVRLKSLDDAVLAASRIASLGIGTIVMTLGEKGALIYRNGQHTLHDAFDVAAVDATGAGDAFSAALAVSTAKGDDIDVAVRYANAAAAIAVTRVGAQCSLPSAEEVGIFLDVLDKS